MHDVGGGWISGNTLISYNDLAVKLNANCSGVYVTGNMEYTGWPVDPPIASASANILEGQAPLNVTFSSGGSYDPNGVINSFDWNFHDGNIASGPGVSHTFTEVRTHTVTLIVTDADGFKDMDYVIIRVAPEEEIITGVSKTHHEENLMLNIYPNPFNSYTNITFELISTSNVNIQIYDLEGKRVRHLFSGDLIPGSHKMSWNGQDDMGIEVPAGIYITKCIAGDHQQSKRIVFLR